MEAVHRDLLVTNRTYLIENLDPTAFDNALVEEKLLREDEFEELRSKATRKQKVECLLSKLPRKGPTAFDRFLKVLEKTTGQEFVAAQLKPRDASTIALAIQEVEQTDGDNTENGELEEPDASRLSDEYTMKAKPRGRALIINNKRFTGEMKTRTGTDIDADSLEGLFRYLSFEVERVDNQKGSQIRKLARDLSTADHSKYDAVIVAILSHGENGQIYGMDEELIPVEQLISYFKSSQSLAGKPKLFFLQACRGGRMDSGVDVPDGFDDSDINTPAVEAFIKKALADDEVDAALSTSTLPSDADFLLSYATTPGYVSWRNQARGSWYVDALVQVVYKHAPKEHLLDMLTMVNQKVATEYQSSSGAKKQIPGPVTMLTKKLYFKPGK